MLNGQIKNAKQGEYVLLIGKVVDGGNPGSPTIEFRMPHQSPVRWAITNSVPAIIAAEGEELTVRMPIGEPTIVSHGPEA